LIFQFVGHTYKPSSPTATASEFESLYRSSVWRAVQADSRYSTETVWREWNGSQWINKTWQDAWIAAGSPTGASSTDFNKANNVAFAKKMQAYDYKMHDYALHKFLYEPARQVFPGIKCGNSDSIFSTTSSIPWYEPQNSWLKYPVTNFPNTRHLHADYSAPHIFSPNINDANGGFYKYPPIRYNPTYYQNETDPLYAPDGAFWVLLGHPFGDTTVPGATSDRLVYREFNKNKYRSLLTNNPHPAIGWLESPGQMAGSEIPNWKVADSTVGDVLEIMQTAYSLGQKQFKMFNPFMYNPNLYGNTQKKIDDAYALFTQFRDWVNVQPGAGGGGTPHIIEDGLGGQTGAVIGDPYMPRIRYPGLNVSDVSQTPPEG